MKHIIIIDFQASTGTGYNGISGIKMEDGLSGIGKVR